MECVLNKNREISDLQSLKQFTYQGKRDKKKENFTKSLNKWVRGFDSPKFTGYLNEGNSSCDEDGSSSSGGNIDHLDKQRRENSSPSNRTSVQGSSVSESPKTEQLPDKFRGLGRGQRLLLMYEKITKPAREKEIITVEKSIKTQTSQECTEENLTRQTNKEKSSVQSSWVNNSGEPSKLNTSEDNPGGFSSRKSFKKYSYKSEKYFSKEKPLVNNLKTYTNANATEEWVRPYSTESRISKKTYEKGVNAFDVENWAPANTSKEKIQQNSVKEWVSANTFQEKALSRVSQQWIPTDNSKEKTLGCSSKSWSSSDTNKKEVRGRFTKEWAQANTSQERTQSNTSKSNLQSAFSTKRFHDKLKSKSSGKTHKEETEGRHSRERDRRDASKESPIGFANSEGVIGNDRKREADGVYFPRRNDGNAFGERVQTIGYPKGGFGNATKEGVCSGFVARGGDGNSLQKGSFLQALSKRVAGSASKEGVHLYSLPERDEGPLPQERSHPNTFSKGSNGNYYQEGTNTKMHKKSTLAGDSHEKNCSSYAKNLSQNNWLCVADSALRTPKEVVEVSRLFDSSVSSVEDTESGTKLKEKVVKKESKESELRDMEKVACRNEEVSEMVSCFHISCFGKCSIKKENVDVSLGLVNLSGSKNNLSDWSECKNLRMDERGGWMQGNVLEGQIPSVRASKNNWTPFVLFTDSFVKPIDRFRDLSILPSIIENLQKEGNYDELSPVQRWVIPSIRKQHNVIVIGSSRTGKSLGYVVPITDYIQDQNYFDELGTGNGPYVVVLCSGSRVCEMIHWYFITLLGKSSQEKNSKIRVTIAHGGGSERDKWVKLTNGCHILITTPPCFVRLLQHPIIANLSRLSCLVLDDVDVISQEPFHDDLKSILDKVRQFTKERVCQLIMSGEKWTPAVENLANFYVKSYALVIGSYSEAVVYSKLKPKLFIIDKSVKAEHLVGVVREKFGKNKIMVICEDASDAIYIFDHLISLTFNAVVAHEKTTADEINVLRATWKYLSPTPVLVTTDSVLNELKIRDVQVMIHFTLPARSKTNFFYRYSVFLESYKNLKEGYKTDSKRLDYSDIIYVDDENHSQLPHIVNFISRLGAVIPDPVKNLVERVYVETEKSKTKSPLCDSLLSFGKCRKTKRCPQRHLILSDIDGPSGTPVSGWVKFYVLRVRDTSTCYVRLIEHLDKEGKRHKVIDNNMVITCKMAKYFGNDENRVVLDTPKFGNLCAIKSQIRGFEVFYRGEVLECFYANMKNEPLEVSVRLLDYGDILCVKAFNVFVLPDELTTYPPMAVEVKIGKIQPPDYDSDWSVVSKNYASTLLKKNIPPNQYWMGKIGLSLKNILILETVLCKTLLENLKLETIELNFEQELLKAELCIANDEHIPSLLKLAQEGGLIVSSELKESVCSKNPQWVYFENDFVQVKFVLAISTSSIFFQIKNFSGVLERLDAACLKEGTESRKDTTNCGKLPLAIRMFCLVFFRDKWYRGRIDREKDSEFFVFLVDYGSSDYFPKDVVLPISDQLLFTYPCQIVECSLIGVRSEEFNEESLNELQKFTNDGSKDMYAKVISKDVEPKTTGGPKYAINLINSYGTSLNKHLIENKFVSIEESEISFVTNLDVEFLEPDDPKPVEKEPKMETESVSVNVEEVDCDTISSDDNDCKQDDSWSIVEDVFTNNIDSLFEDDVSKEFLNEFASQFLLPHIESQYISTGSIESEGPKPKENIIEKLLVDVEKWKEDNEDGSEGEAFEGRKKVEDDQVETETEERMKKKREKMKSAKERIENLEEEKLRSRDELYKLVSDDVFTPEVHWSQNHKEVQLKVMLADISDYRLDCGPSNVYFRCRSGNKLYAFDIKLYGGICPQASDVLPKPFHVLVRLKKLWWMPWPRLPKDESRFHWIKLDVDSFLVKWTPTYSRSRSESEGEEKGTRTLILNDDGSTDNESVMTDSDECSLESF